MQCLRFKLFSTGVILIFFAILSFMMLYYLRESVCPRILILRCCRELLTKQRYREAFLLLRTHRVDLNVLYDHSPSEWVHEARDFVRQLASEDYLNLFLSSLRYCNNTGWIMMYYLSSLTYFVNMEYILHIGWYCIYFMLGVTAMKTWSNPNSRFIIRAKPTR